MNFSKTIDILQNRACPSIQYRIKKEILNESNKSINMKNLQNKVLQDDKVQEIMALRQEDGWIGGLFHGEREPESAIRYLTEKGVEGDHPIIIDALNAIINRGDDFDRGCMERVGKPLDLCHLGGSNMIKACVFAYAGNVNQKFVQEQIEEALSAFEYILKLDNLNQLYRIYKDKINVFSDGTRWPSIYHMRLLALTDGWRCKENKRMLISAFNKLVAFSPIPSIKLLYKNQVIAPASAFMDDFNVKMDNLSAKEWMMWFHRTELITRLDIANDIPQIGNQIDYLYEYMNSNDGFFLKGLSHYYFNKWTQYIGLALENNWKAQESRINDLTFRSLLILNLSNRL